MAKPQIRWAEPREVQAARTRAMGRLMRKGLPRCLVVAVGLALPALVLMPRNLMTWRCVLPFGAPVLLFLPALCYNRLDTSPRRYHLGTKGIARVGCSYWPWKMLRGYRVAGHALVPSCRCLLLYAKKGLPRHLALPGDATDEQIIAAVAERIPLLAEAPPDPSAAGPLSRGAAVFLYALALAFGVGAGYALAAGLGKGLPKVALVAPILLGPGTIGLAVLYRREFFGRGCPWAPSLFFNVLGWVLMALYLAVFAARRLLGG